MQAQNHAFKPAGRPDWTAERIERLETADLRQLRENAERLGADTIVTLCDAALSARPQSSARGGKGSRAPKQARHLISRQKAFQARGVYLRDGTSGWSGVRSSDGVVVMTLWAAAIESSQRGCQHLLWAPNVDGTRSWSDSAGGKERLRHCRLAHQAGGGEGLLVYGQHFDGEAAEHNARTVFGVDPERVVQFQVQLRGQEYWAVWG